MGPTRNLELLQRQVARRKCTLKSKLKSRIEMVMNVCAMFAELDKARYSFKHGVIALALKNGCSRQLFKLGIGIAW